MYAVAAVVMCIASAHACGVERWGAKVLADGTTHISGPYRASIVGLRSLQRPYGVDYAYTRTPAERIAYRVRGELLGFKLENDGDIHLIIAQPGERAKTLVAEIPDPRCMAGAPAKYIKEVEQSRLNLIRGFGIPPYRTFRLAYAPVTLVGVAFFDFEHGQSGSAPNNFELHPVLAITSAGAGPVIATTPRAFANRGTTRNTASCGGDALVWVNTRSGVYHFANSRWYGRSHEGAFMCRREADANGYHPALNE